MPNQAIIVLIIMKKKCTCLVKDFIKNKYSKIQYCILITNCVIVLNFNELLFKK